MLSFSENWLLLPVDIRKRKWVWNRKDWPSSLKIFIDWQTFFESWRSLFCLTTLLQIYLKQDQRTPVRFSLHLTQFLTKAKSRHELLQYSFTPSLQIEVCQNKPLYMKFVPSSSSLNKNASKVWLCMIIPIFSLSLVIIILYTVSLLYIGIVTNFQACLSRLYEIFGTK